MRTVEIKILKFNELSDKAKEAARQWWIKCETEDSTSDEDVYEDASTIAELFGLDIKTRRVPLMGGGHRYDPAIFYSGFWSQGAGACFEGTYEYKKGAYAAVKAHAPEDKELHEIVRQLQMAQAKNFYQVACTTKHSGHYYHSGCMSVEPEHGSNSVVNDEDAFIQALREFADWIYKRLEDAWDYTVSDEHVDESMESNDYEFTEDGEVYI